VGNDVLLYNTLNKRHVEYNEQAKFVSFEDNAFLYVCDLNNCVFLEELARNGFGYMITCQVKPIQYTGIYFTSSKEKYNNALSYLDGQSTLNMIKHISIFHKGYREFFSDKEICESLNIPYTTHADVSDAYELLEQYSFPNLEEIEIVTSITTDLQSIVAELEKLSTAVISVRVVITRARDIDRLISFATSFNTCLIKIILPLRLANDVTFGHLPSNISIKAYSSDIDEIISSKFPNIFPLIYDSEKQSRLINACKLNKIDILDQNSLSFEEIRQNKIINKQFWGHITIYGGNVLSGNQTICSIKSFAVDFNNWIYSNNCNWFLTRAKSSKCKQCLYADLCPSISRLEELNIIKFPCSFH
jgi:hypothetical protein